jgi:transcription elongation factor Elf1
MKKKNNSQLLTQIAKRNEVIWECPRCCWTTAKVSNLYTGAEDWNGVVVCSVCNSNMKRRDK